jgi:hypothetical protein
MYLRRSRGNVFGTLLIQPLQDKGDGKELGFAQACATRFVAALLQT